FPAEIDELLFSEAAFQEGPRIHARRRVPLEIHQVAAVVLGGGVPEMVEADAEHRAHGSEAGDMTAQITLSLIGLSDHDHGVPAAIGTDALFQGVVARV